MRDLSAFSSLTSNHDGILHWAARLLSVFVPSSRAATRMLGLILVVIPVAYSQSGSISASPNPCSLTAGSTTCTSTISWSSQGTSNVQVYVNNSLFSSTGGGGPFIGTAPWIQGSPNSYNFVLYNYSSGTRGAVLGSVTVTAVSTTLTCGTSVITGDPSAPGQQVTLTIPGSGATSVSVQITGATTNPYSNLIPAASQRGGSWIAVIPTGSLLGEYLATPVLSNSSGKTTCTQSAEPFNIELTTPATPGPAACASMTGTWMDTASGQPTLTWTLIQPSGVGVQPVAGTATAVSYQCGTAQTWNVTGSSLNTATGTYNIYGTGGTPAQFTCDGTTYTTLDQYITGTLATLIGDLEYGACALAEGTFEGLLAGTVKVGGTNYISTSERIPSGETTSASGWSTAYGFPTTALFNVALAGKPNVNYGGRAVTETNPVGSPGTDGCTYPGAPFGPYTKLASTDTWYVQPDNQFGHYGPDYVGLGASVVAYYQLFAPTMKSPGTCTIQYPQEMVINVEGAGTGTEPYGGNESGMNELEFTVNPNQVIVSRGGITQAETFHF